MATIHTSNPFLNMSADLIKEKVKPVFVTATPSAAVKYSEPMNIVSIHYNEIAREIKAVGADGNVRVCRIDRLQSVDHARTLWKILVGVKNESKIISFMSAGGFSPDRWFFDVCAE